MIKEICQDLNPPGIIEKAFGVWEDTLREKCHPRKMPGTLDRLLDISSSHSIDLSTKGVHHDTGIPQVHLVIHTDDDWDVTLEGKRHGDDTLCGDREGKRQENYRITIKDCHNVSYISQKTTDKESDSWDGTCLHPNPVPSTHDTIHDIPSAHPSMGTVPYSIGKSQENTDTHQDSDMVGVRDKLHGYLATHSGDVKMGKARYGRDRFHGEETIPKDNILKEHFSVPADTFTLGVKCPLEFFHPQPEPEPGANKKDNEEDHRSKSILYMRLNDSLCDSKDEINFASGYFNKSIRLANREYPLQTFFYGYGTYFTEDKVHIFTSDGRNNKHTTNIVTNTDSFYVNPVIKDNKESVKRLEDTSGQGYCKYYFQTPFALEINVDRSNESPGFKNNEEDDRSKETLSLRFNDSLHDSKDEVNFLSGYLNRGIRDTLVKREYLLQSSIDGQRINFDNKEPVVNKYQDEKKAYNTEDKVENRASIKKEDKKQKEVKQNKNIRDGLALHNIKFTKISAKTTFKLRIELEDKKQKEMEQNKNIRDGLALHND